MKRILLVTVVALLCLPSCAHVISHDILQEVDREITFAELQKAPEDYQGKVVLLGGVIIKVVNKREGSLLEIYQTELDRKGRPVNIDVSQGRFLALNVGLLDSEIYRRGRKVTIVGVVQGEEVIRLGEIDYPCPYLVVKEIHLWEEEWPRAYAPYYAWCYPWYPYYCRPWFCTYGWVHCCYPWWGPRRYPVIYDPDPDHPLAIKSGLFRRWLKERQVRVEKQRQQLLPNHHSIAGRHQESQRSVRSKPRLMSSSYSAIQQISRQSQGRLRAWKAPRIPRSGQRFQGKVGFGLKSKIESLRKR